MKKIILFFIFFSLNNTNITLYSSASVQRSIVKPNFVRRLNSTYTPYTIPQFKYPDTTDEDTSSKNIPYTIQTNQTTSVYNPKGNLVFEHTINPDKSEIESYYGDKENLKFHRYQTTYNNNTHSLSTFYNNNGKIENRLSTTRYPNNVIEMDTYDANGFKKNRSIIDKNNNKQSERSVEYNRFGYPTILSYISNIMTDYNPLDTEIYTYDKNGNNVGAIGKFDINGLDRENRDIHGKLAELD